MELIKRTLKHRHPIILPLILPQGRDVGWQRAELLVLDEGVAHHTLDVELFRREQVQDDLVGDSELGDQVLAGVVHHANHVGGLWEQFGVFYHYDYGAFLVEATSASATRHLHVL
jgi:hypothetical protein